MGRKRKGPDADGYRTCISCNIRFHDSDGYRPRSQGNNCHACYLKKHQEWKESGKYRQWFEANKDRVREYQKEYRDKHKKERREYVKQYTQKRGPEYFNSLKVKSYWKNREDHLATQRRRRKVGHYNHFYLLRNARLKGAVGFSNLALLAGKLAYYGRKCRYCAVELIRKSNLSWDHAIPISRGGSNWTSNLIPCCRTCNDRKGTKTIFEYMERLKNSGKN